MGLFDWLKKKKEPTVLGTLQYVPGSQTPNQDEPVILEGDELKRRMFVQPEAKSAEEHSNIRIYTGNPFRLHIQTT